MEKKNIKILFLLAKESYNIVIFLFVIMMIIATLILFYKEQLPNWFAFTYTLIIGVFLGYTYSYFSIKYLHKNKTL